jgi:hypothetical protein
MFCFAQDEKHVMDFGAQIRHLGEIIEAKFDTHSAVLSCFLLPGRANQPQPSAPSRRASLHRATLPAVCPWKPRSLPYLALVM